MNCIRCGAEINSTTDVNYTCPNCGKEVYYSAYKQQNCDTSLPQDFDKKEGWICPVCGRGVAPWVDYCPCKIDGNITWVATTVQTDYKAENKIEDNDK